jgi:lipopolysaccharide/colanic/teichoic acid biosynthesis glycosyltransferase
LRAAIRRPGENDSTYAARLVAVVHRSMAHVDASSLGPDVMNARVPLRENYVLSAAALVRPSVYARYEFIDPARAMERGFGVCSQFALVTSELLRQNGLHARLVSLGDHMIVSLRLADGREILLDSDFGVLVPRSLDDLQADPAQAGEFYAGALATDVRIGHAPTIDVERSYGPVGNVVYAEMSENTGLRKVWVFERLAYVVKWLLPVLAILPALMWRRPTLSRARHEDVVSGSRPQRGDRARSSPEVRGAIRLSEGARDRPNAATDQGYSATLVYRTAGKRLFDVIVASLALLVLAPVIFLLALVVRARMGGPILFRQTRPGRHGRPFQLYKLRTMRVATDARDAESPDSDRLTPFGTWLRSTSLDELPELWNVLRGDMSLVGPRPLLLEYLPLYSAEQAHRHDVRPGLTGWAQVNGRNTVEWADRFRLDVWYVHHLSFGLDLRILVATVKSVLRRDGISQTGHATIERFTGASR